MPPSNVLHLPARHVPRPGATRPACSSREAGRTSRSEAGELLNDYLARCREEKVEPFPMPSPIGEASDRIVQRMIRERRDAFYELEEREREDAGNGGMVVVAIVFLAMVAALGATVALVAIPNLQHLFRQVL